MKQWRREVIPRFCRSGGLTLVEVVLALVILGILMAVAMVAFRNGVQGALLQRAADRLVADLHLVHSQALRDRADREIIFDVASRSYSSTTVRDPDTGQLLSVSLAGFRISSMSVTGLTADHTVTFDALGDATPAVTIVLHSGSRAVTVTVSEEGAIEQVD